MMAPAVDGTGGHGCFPATNTSPAPEHRAAAISPAGCAPTSPGQDQPLADLDAWADVDTGLQHVHVKGEDDPLRHLGDEDLLDGDWAAARPADTEYDVTEIADDGTALNALDEVGDVGRPAVKSSAGDGRTAAVDGYGAAAAALQHATEHVAADGLDVDTRACIQQLMAQQAVLVAQNKQIMRG